MTKKPMALKTVLSESAGFLKLVFGLLALRTLLEMVFLASLEPTMDRQHASLHRH
jgi:hypothetical protein